MPPPPPPLLRVGQLHPEWHRLVSDQGRIPPPKRLVSLGEVRRTPIFGFRRFSPFLSDLDWWVAGVLVSQAGERLQGDVSLESNVFLLDALAKESQDHKALTLPPPKRPAQTLTTLVSSKRPKQNPQPTGRGRVKFKVKGRFPGHSAHRGKGRGANKGRNVPDVRMPACMKAPEVPPLTVRTSVQSPEKIAGRLSKFSGGAWSEIGADLWVMRIVQWGYKIPLVTLPPLRLQGQETTYPKGSLEWSSLSQSVQELRNKGAIEPTSLSRAVTADCSLFARQQGSGGRSYDLSSLKCFRALPELHYGDTSVIFRAPQQGQWLTSLDLKDAYFHIGSTQQTDAVLSQRHLLAVYSTVIRVVNQSKSISKILKPVLAIAHLHRVKIALVHRRLVVKTQGHARKLSSKHPGSSLCAESLGWF